MSNASSPTDTDFESTFVPAERLPSRAARVFIALAAMATVGMGVALRLVLAGKEVPYVKAAFSAARHAHTHLGYFGVLMPLAGLVLVPRLPAWAKWSTAVAALVATGGFLAGGYNLVSIVGSTVVGLVWLFAAVFRAKASAQRGFDTTAVVGVAIACLCIPPIAIYTPRDPALAVDIVHTFLAVLVNAVLAPAMLSRVAGTPPYWAYTPFALIAAVGAGLYPAWWTTGAFAVCGFAWAVMGWSAKRLSSPAAYGWLLSGLGAMGVGLGLIPFDTPVAVAAVHFVFLGPILLTGLDRLGASRAKPAVWLRGAVLIATAGMCASIAVQSPAVLSGAHAAAGIKGAAHGGALVAVLVSALVLVWAFTRAAPAPDA